jgi:hypothetical protein
VIGLIAVVIICGTVVWSIRTLLQFGQRWLDLRFPPVKHPDPPTPVPADLLVHTQSYGDAWAREEALERMYELYSKLQNWDRVRMAVAAQDSLLTVETDQ